MGVLSSAGPYPDLSSICSFALHVRGSFGVIGFCGTVVAIAVAMLAASFWLVAPIKVSGRPRASGLLDGNVNGHTIFRTIRQSADALSRIFAEGCRRRSRSGRHRPCRVLLLGLDNSGKTALCQLLTRCTKERWPSVQLRPEHHVLHHEVEIQGCVFDFIDPSGHSGGHDDHRLLLWNDLLVSRPDAIVFMVDAADSGRFLQVQDALHWALQHEAVRYLPILVLGNKVDLGVSLDKWDFEHCLGLTGLNQGQLDALLGVCHASTTDGYNASVPGRASYMDSNSLIPLDLRFRIASFHPQQPAKSPPHGGPLAVRMCSLAKRSTAEVALRWLAENVHSEHIVRRSFCQLLLERLLSVFAKCLGGGRFLARHAVLLPLYQA
eukprot:TRINITY_DN76217_c0_g1_i1.p1 TRINITY_DN76217_c0_g1~~TRINITY_DN76217_c0_g1_i1.p1  ORF type:complete len:379 (+),score=35.06 TRINITY_DN76217_c0_g1_i1:197-1333(+)